jgi:hypothetical protein
LVPYTFIEILNFNIDKYNNYFNIQLSVY